MMMIDFTNLHLTCWYLQFCFLTSLPCNFLEFYSATLRILVRSATTPRDAKEGLKFTTPDFFKIQKFTLPKWCQNFTPEISHFYDSKRFKKETPVGCFYHVLICSILLLRFVGYIRFCFSAVFYSLCLSWRRVRE